jgi:hypothetical protein
MININIRECDQSYFGEFLHDSKLLSKYWAVIQNHIQYMFLWRFEKKKFRSLFYKVDILMLLSPI